MSARLSPESGKFVLRPTDKSHTSAPRSNDGLTLGGATSAIFRHAFLVIVLTVAGSYAGYLASQLVKDRYQATAVLVIDSRLGLSLSGGVEETNPLLIQATVSTAAETIGSDAVIDRALSEMTEGDILALSAESNVDVRLAEVDPAPADPETWRRQTLVQHLSGNLTVDNNGRSYLIKISYYAGDPALAARVVNGVARAYGDFRLDARQELYKGVLEGMNAELEQLRFEVMKSETAAQIMREEAIVIRERSEALIGQPRSDAIARAADLYARQREAERATSASADVLERLMREHRSVQTRVSFRDTDIQLLSAAVPAIQPSGPNMRPIILVMGGLTGFLLAASIAVSRVRSRRRPKDA